MILQKRPQYLRSAKAAKGSGVALDGLFGLEKRFREDIEAADIRIIDDNRLIGYPAHLGYQFRPFIEVGQEPEGNNDIKTSVCKGKV